MAVATFDTLKYSRQLKSAGLNEEQAEGLTNALADALQTGIQELATKSDIALLRTDLEKFRQESKSENNLLRQEIKSDNTQLRQEMKSENALLRQEMKNLESQFSLVKWMLAIGFSTILAALARLMFFPPK